MRSSSSTPSLTIRNYADHGVAIAWSECWPKAFFKSGVLVALATYNTTFTFHSVYAGFRDPAAAAGLADLFWCVTLIEALAIARNLIGMVSHSLALRIFAVDHTALNALMVVRHLEGAGSFSFFWFVPSPAKLQYWWDKKWVLYDEFVRRPGALRMGRDGRDGAAYFSVWEAESRAALWQLVGLDRCCCHSAFFVLCVKTLFLAWALAHWFWVRCLQPVGFVLCVFAAIPAVMVKLANLPNLSDQVELALAGDWASVAVKTLFPYLGIIIQASKTWAIREVELIAVAQFLNVTVNDGDRDRQQAIHRLRDIILDAVVRKLTHFQAVLFLSLLDTFMVARIFRFTHREGTLRHITEEITGLRPAEAAAEEPLSYGPRQLSMANPLRRSHSEGPPEDVEAQGIRRTHSDA